MHGALTPNMEEEAADEDCHPAPRPVLLHRSALSEALEV